MMRNEYKMTSMDRISDSLDFKEPDRVPISFNLTLQAAKEMNISLKTFFSDPEKVAEGQLLMLEKYGFDTVTSSYYGGLETEAWGGSVKFYEDGPPNVNKLIIQDFEDIFDIDVPNVYENKNTQKVIRTTEILKDNLADDVPIMGGIISPFSLPITQMGFSKYFELL
ncbi:MAG: uroporphyrinogen decarboxylase family protein [Promethearchaeia archaeon]